MSNVNLSVVIPCYNRERFIGEAISSALAQGKDVEVIVVDDGSTDGSWQTIRSYGDRIIALQISRAGPSAARNRGLAAATGKYVHFLDSDDRLAPGALPAMLEAADRLAGRQIAVGDSVNIDERGGPLPGATRGYADIAPGVIERATILSAPMSTPLPLFPANALRDVGGFDERLRHFEDRELAIRLLASGYSFVHVPIVICEVRDHSDNRLSAVQNKAKFEHMAAAMTTMSRHLLRDRQFLRSTEERSAFGKLCWSAARNAARARYKPVSAELFGLAESIAGREAWSGHWSLRAMYRLMPPYVAERAAEALKSLGRLGRTK